ncbi:MAG: aromatic ring-hydroxylating dioxygenase subunit alpha [Elainellaceae cyanobacterium]
MLVTQEPVFKQFWYPVVPIAQLQESPQSFVLLGQRLALWLTEDGTPAAVEDRCCHRSAQLSKGVVVKGSIQCPYHGWSFNGEGACVQVPQLPDAPIPQSYRVKSFHCTERYGYAWVCLDQPLTDLPEIPEASDSQFRYIPQLYEQWECAGLRLMENSFDNAHPHFVHANTFGIHQEPVPPQPDEFEEMEFGLRMRYKLPVFNTDIQKQNLRIEGERTVRISEGTWYMPFARTLKITYPNGLVHLIFTAATPINDRISQIVQFCFRNDTEADASAESINAFDRLVTLEDKVILEGTDYDVPLVTADEQHMFTDKPGIVMRHKLAALIKAHTEQPATQPAAV